MSEITVSVIEVAPTAPRRHYSAQYGNLVATAEYTDRFETLLLTASPGADQPADSYAVASFRGNMARLLPAFSDDVQVWLAGFLDKARQLHEQAGGARV